MIGSSELRNVYDSTQERQKCPDCGWIYYRDPSPGVVVLIVKEDKVLLRKRPSGTFGAGKWCLPGGFIEYDEDFLSAAIREVDEETGITIEIKSILSVVSNFLSDRLHTLVVVLLGNAIDGIPTPGDDIVELKWFPLSGPLPNMAFKADRHIVERYEKTNMVGIPVDPTYTGINER